MPETVKYIELTVENVTAALDRAIEKRGADYVYPERELATCYYVIDGEPSCLVGEVLVDLGVPIEKLGEPMVNTSRFGVLVIAGDYLSTAGWDPTLLRVPLNVRRGLSRAQSEQDMGATWGLARDVFLEEVQS